MKILNLILSFLFVYNICVFAAKSEDQKSEIINSKKLIITAWKLSSRISPDPKKLEYVFDKSFFSYISKGKVIELLKNLYSENGLVVDISTVSIQNDLNGDFLFKTDRDMIIPVTISIEEKKGKITGLFFRPSFKKTSGINEVMNDFEKLKYSKKAILIRKLGQIEDTIYAKNENEIMAIASSFKLYILASLLEEGSKWEKVIKIKEEEKSAFSKLSTYPENAPLTIFSLASAMISESDNTSSDILIDYIGREKIEKRLPSFYNTHPELNIPFLKTAEIFKIKYSTSISSGYLSLKSEKEKRKFLEKIKKEKIDIFKVKLNEPVLIDKIEWFSSMEDICKLMDYFRKKNDPYINTILSINTGLDTKTPAFAFAGYKGGSEPGVISMNWLLKTKQGTWYCLSSAINDEKQLIEQKDFFSAMQNVLNIIGNESF